MNEESAIQLCLKHRDPTGFEFLVKKYRREAFHHAYALLGNPDDAADACQESFARAFAAIPRLEKLSGFYPWFYRILRNCCLNLLSRRKTSSEYIRINLQNEDGVAEVSDPSNLLQAHEDQQAVWRALQGLKPSLKEILILKYFRGSRYEEISEILDIPRGTVMSRLYQARRAFRDRFLKPVESQMNYE